MNFANKFFAFESAQGQDLHNIILIGMDKLKFFPILFLSVGGRKEIYIERTRRFQKVTEKIPKWAIINMFNLIKFYRIQMCTESVWQIYLDLIDMSLKHLKILKV